MINIRAFLVTRSSYWYQDICPCDLGHLLNRPLLGAFVFHKHILLFRGTGKDLTASVFETSIWIPSFVNTRPRYFIEVRANAHLLGLSVNPADVSLEKICSKYCRCSWKEFEKTRMSSTYRRQVFQFKPRRTQAINAWKLAGAFTSPNGMRFHS